MAKKSGNRLRIIGGEWRSRMLPIADVEGLRPTTDRVRETLFNWLQPYVPAARVLDMFAGAGALGFESLSRGASEAVMLEKHAKAAKQLKLNAQTLGTTEAKIVATDALTWIEHESEPFDIVYLDPPFNKGLLPKAIERLDERGLIKNNGWIYLESEASLADLPIPKHWRLHREKKAGMVMLRLFQAET